jgi:hypothetical protein
MVVGFEVLGAVVMKISVIWAITRSSTLEHVASIFRVEEKLCLPPDFQAGFSLGLKMGVTCSSEKCFVFRRTTCCCSPEEHIEATFA